MKGRGGGSKKEKKDVLAGVEKEGKVGVKNTGKNGG